MLGLHNVRTACLETLNDERERSWDDEVTCCLDRDYADWKNPQGTHMVPCEFSYRKRKSDIGEQTEKKFFDLLQNFGESHSEPMFVIHSYNFAEMISEWKKTSCRIERKWVTGEHDFVIIHRLHGIIFFQVKAAVKRKGKYLKAQEQIEKDKMALQAFVNDNLGGKFKRDMDAEIYKYPGFVVMPNCPCPNDSVVKPSNGVFQENCENVNAFSTWWNTKVAAVKRDAEFDHKLFECLVMRFVGMSHSIPVTLSKSIEGNKKAIEVETREQLSIILNSLREKWITGPAGSGKTWLLETKVSMLIKDAYWRGTKEKILVVCYNKPLSLMLEKKFNDVVMDISGNANFPKVFTVKTFESLLYDITGSKSGNRDQEKAEHVAQALELVEKGTVFTQRYDHIFVDECQDLCGDKWPTLFKRLHKDDDDDDDDDDNDDDDDDNDWCEPKHIWFLYDTNQNLKISKVQYQHHRESIKKSFWLSKVFRNTRMVFDQSKKYFKSKIPNVKPIELAHDVCGLEIKWDDSLTSPSVEVECGARCIRKHIEDLRRQKVDDKDICILTQNAVIRNEISSELKKVRIENQNAEHSIQNDVNKVVVESIWRFKGLESKVVVLYNPPFSQENEWTVKRLKELLYTAVSRCFCYLIVISTKPGCDALKSRMGIDQKIIDGRGEASHQSSDRLASMFKWQKNALFNDRFSKRGMETQYESGPPEPESPSKRSIEDDDDDIDPNDIKRSPPKLLRKEEAEHLYKKISKNVEKRPVKVPGCDLLEPGDPYIKDSIRNNGIKLLEEPVKQNLRYQPGSSDESFKDDDITSVVAQIEYNVYDQRRREINPKKYTKDCKTLKNAIMDSTKNQTCHESVLNALRKFRATKHS